MDKCPFCTYSESFGKAGAEIQAAASANMELINAHRIEGGEPLLSAAETASGLIFVTGFVLGQEIERRLAGATACGAPRPLLDKAFLDALCHMHQSVFVTTSGILKTKLDEVFP